MSRLACVRHLILRELDRDLLTQMTRMTRLTHISFDEHFDTHVVAGVLPAGLTHLTFGNGFYKPVAVGVLPAGLTHLAFGDVFNQPLAVGVLLSSLTRRPLGMISPATKEVRPVRRVLMGLESFWFLV